nr:envelope glycoprotein {immunodominant epitope region} [human T lymphotropic virus type II HTLV-II, Seminole Indian isolate, Peptide Partial, 177 aa] [Human T-lymphotropic virus 2]
HWIKKPNRQGLGYYSPSYNDPCSLQCPYLGCQSWTCPYTGPVSSPSWKFHSDVNFTQEVSQVSLRLHFSKCGSSMTLLVDAPGYDPLWFITSEPTQPPPTSPPLVHDSDLEHVLTPSTSWTTKILKFIQLTLQSTNYSCMVCVDRSSLSSWHVLYTPNISIPQQTSSRTILFPSLAL